MKCICVNIALKEFFFLNALYIVFFLFLFYFCLVFLRILYVIENFSIKLEIWLVRWVGLMKTLDLIFSLMFYRLALDYFLVHYSNTVTHFLFYLHLQVCSYFRSVHFTTFLAIPTVSRRDAPGSGGLLNTTDQKADTQSSLQWNQLRPKVGVNITGRDRLLHKYIVFK